MVAKISVGSSLFGALSYNQNKVDEQQGKVLLSNRMFESEDGNFSIRRCMECFDMHLPADLKTEKTDYPYLPEPAPGRCTFR